MKKYSSRLERWETPLRIPCMYHTEDDVEFQMFLEKRITTSESKKKGLTYDELLGGCKELIFDLQNGYPIFICMNITLDSHKFELVFSQGWQTVPESDKTEEEIKEDVLSTLARASMYDVPVYPNTADLEPILAQYYEELVINGFVAHNEDGSKVRLINTDSPKEGIRDISYFLNRDPSININPAELALLKQVTKETFQKLSRADKVLTNLINAIGQFDAILSLDRRNERKLQKCLLENPILFGLDYVRVIPEHRLGSDYVVDYGLEKFSGNFDVVELESSNLSLYNKNGDPTSYLVHAEQQVLDWLAWIEQNSPYANTKLPGISSPTGFVIIGRNSTPDEFTTNKLKWRNIAFGDRVQILTYDDLLTRAKNVHKVLQGKE